MSGIISTILLIFGSIEATNIKDHDIFGKPLAAKKKKPNLLAIQLSRFRLETVFTLTTSFVIILISGQIIFHGVIHLIQVHQLIMLNFFSILGSGLASVLMLAIFFINRYFGKKLNNISLLAAAKDSLVASRILCK